MAIAIYYGQSKIVKILQENEIEKGSQDLNKYYSINDHYRKLLFKILMFFHLFFK